MTRAALSKAKEVYNLQVIRFLFVGGVSFFVEFAIFAGLVDFFGVNYMHANVVAMAFAIVLNYFLTRWLVFEGGRYSSKITFVVFMLFTLFGVMLNQALLWFLVEQTLTNVKVSKVLVTVAVAVFNYYTKKHIVFRR
jgi:putative flippase GtrA